MLDEGKILLELNWTEEEKKLIKNLLDNLYSYKSLIPKALKKDIKLMLELANKIKSDHDTLLEQNSIPNEQINNQIDEITEIISDCSFLLDVI